MKRLSNIELLRILSTLSVIAFHIIAQSNALGQENSNNFIFSVIFHGGGRAACSIFVMIGAYFLVDEKFKIERVARIWLKTFCCCVVINLLFVLHSENKLSNTGFNWIEQFFPFFCEPYWYIKNYICLLFLSPMINAFINDTKCNNYRKIMLSVVMIWILGYSFPRIQNKSIFTSDLIWFVVLYLIIGELKRRDLLKRIRYSGVIAVLLYILMCLSTILFDSLKSDYPYFWNIRFWNISNYSGILVFLFSFFSFVFFVNLDIGNSKIINLGGEHTFGIFLIHQVPILYEGKYNIWIDFWKIDRFFNSYYFVPYCFVILLCTFLFSLIIDFFIDLMMKRIFLIRGIQNKLLAIDKYVEDR